MVANEACSQQYVIKSIRGDSQARSPQKIPKDILNTPLSLWRLRLLDVWIYYVNSDHSHHNSHHFNKWESPRWPIFRGNLLLVSGRVSHFVQRLIRSTFAKKCTERTILVHRTRLRKGKPSYPWVSVPIKKDDPFGSIYLQGWKIGDRYSFPGRKAYLFVSGKFRWVKGVWFLHKSMETNIGTL